jgi:predicted RNase H-like nuclease (RuvC/YqgF family)
MNFSKKWRLALGIVLFAVVGVIINAYPRKSSSSLQDMAGAQDVRSLDRRISSLEQRFYFLESSINRLQQSAVSQRPPVSQPSTRDQEINLLRGEIQTLQLRLNEIECGLVKIDERTTTSSIREARKSAGAKTVDPCRLNPATPLRLSTRP